MKKNMTQRALAANRQNSAKSTGPTSTAGKLTVSRNAFKHGLLANKLRFTNDDEKSTFEELLNQLVREHTPQGVLECSIVEEIALCLWKIADATELASRAVRNRDRTTKFILQNLAEQSGGDSWLSERGTGSKLAGLECKEFLLRTGVTEKETSSLLDEEEEKRERTLVGARLGSSLETTLRYMTALKRDLYRAIDKLAALQRARTGAKKEPDRA